MREHYNGQKMRIIEREKERENARRGLDGGMCCEREFVSLQMDNSMCRNRGVTHQPTASK